MCANERVWLISTKALKIKSYAFRASKLCAYKVTARGKLPPCIYLQSPHLANLYLTSKNLLCNSILKQYINLRYKLID